MFILSTRWTFQEKCKSDKPGQVNLQEVENQLVEIAYMVSLW